MTDCTSQQKIKKQYKRLRFLGDLKHLKTKHNNVLKIVCMYVGTYSCKVDQNVSDAIIFVEFCRPALMAFSLYKTFYFCCNHTINTLQ